MGHPLYAVHDRPGAHPKLVCVQAPDVCIGPVQPVEQDIAVHAGGQIFLALSLGQQLPQTGGGDIHQAGQGDGGDPRLGEGLLQVLPLGGEDLLPVLFGTPEGAHTRQLQNFLRLVPPVEGEEHVRPHEQPQLRPASVSAV